MVREGVALGAPEPVTFAEVLANLANRTPPGGDDGIGARDPDRRLLDDRETP